MFITDNLGLNFLTIFMGCALIVALVASKAVSRISWISQGWILSSGGRAQLRSSVIKKLILSVFLIMTSICLAQGLPDLKTFLSCRTDIDTLPRGFLISWAMLAAILPVKASLSERTSSSFFSRNST